MKELVKLKDNFKKEDLPKKPGVYQFLNKQQVPIYIGKAKNLKNRVLSYYINKERKPEKLKSLIDEARLLDLTVTNTELEALLLEQHLIKVSKPKFNVRFKDDKGYPWIKIETSKKFPSVSSYLGNKKTGDRYYGPFPNSFAVKEVLTIIQKTFKLRNCSDTFFNNRTRPCIQYQIGRCSAPCVGNISMHEYLLEVKDTEMLLEGKGDSLIDQLYLSMDKSASDKEYEKAALYRDKVTALRNIQRSQSISGFNKDIDAVFVANAKEKTVVGLTHVRGGWIVGHENFILGKGVLESSVLDSFLISHYLNQQESPSTIILGEDISDRSTIELALSRHFKKKIKILFKLSSKDKGLLDITKSNTELAIKRITRRIKDISIALESLQELLELKKEIKLIESYDISHLSRSNVVGACISYNKQGKIRDKYRLFNISRENSENDIASMKEIVERRYKNASNKDNCPDLILVDGGFNHLQAVKKVLHSLGLKEIKLIAISKGANRKAEFDILHAEDGSHFRHINNSLGKKLLQEIRDETHRFAITQQRRKQVKSITFSSLDSIKGLGNKRKKSLLRYFGSVGEIANVSLQELTKVSGIGIKTATLIYNYFH